MVSKKDSHEVVRDSRTGRFVFSHSGAVRRTEM
jgi:hypothetical protein